MAQDLLSIKHWEDVPQFRQIPTPETKHEVVSLGHIRLSDTLNMVASLPSVKSSWRLQWRDHLDWG